MFAPNVYLAFTASQTHSSADPLTPQQTQVLASERNTNNGHDFVRIDVDASVFVSVLRPEEGARPPAPGMDPQLPTGGARANDPAGRPGQVTPASLRTVGLSSSTDTNTAARF